MPIVVDWTPKQVYDMLILAHQLNRPPARLVELARCILDTPPARLKYLRRGAIMNTVAIERDALAQLNALREALGHDPYPAFDPPGGRAAPHPNRRPTDEPTHPDLPDL